MRTSRVLAVACLVTLLPGAVGPAAAQAIPTPSVPAPPPEERGADVRGALADSLTLVLIEHGIRIAFQEKTRRELGGNFWGDYLQSLRVPDGWEDSDSWAVNYIGHPIHGAAAGYVWLDHEADPPPEFGMNRRYWGSRARALVWSAGYSYQFEFGPLSEASIGNVGLHPEDSGWVDHVVTPAGSLGFIVAEDALDRYFVRWIERRTGNRFVRATFRMLFGPSRTFANIAGGHLPWYREGRPVSAGR